MSFRTKLVLVFVSVGIAFYTIWGGLFSSFAQQPINDAGAQIRIFESVLQHIQNDYVDEPDLSKVRSGALRGLAYGLDPYSSYLTAEQVKDYQANKQNSQVGIGVSTAQFASYLMVSVIKDSPAEKAGLKSGDVIEYIDTKATRDISLYDAQQMLLGEPGSKVNLRVLRAGTKPITVTVTRGAYKVPSAEARVEDGKIGVVKVYSLEAGEAEDIRNQLQNLTKQGVQKVILDLRGVATGTLEEAAAVSNLFIKEGTLAQVIGRDNKAIKTLTADSAKAIFDGKLVALIDYGTTGAAEAIAAAILEKKRGEVVGEKSFGAGTEQKLFTLKDGDGLLLTVAKWASPNGKPFLGDKRDNSGIQPSVEAKRPENPEPVDPDELAEQDENPQPNPASTPAPDLKAEPAKPAQEDVQLKKALEILRAA